MRKTHAFAVIAALTLGLASCGWLEDLVRPDVNDNDVTQTVIVQPAGTPSPTPTPTPRPGAATVATVEVTQFGERCPAGITPTCPAGVTGSCRTVRVGCRKDLTCTARTADGSDAGSVDPLLRPDNFSAFEGEGTIVRTEGGGDPRGFNRDVLARAQGEAKYSCTVGGVSSLATQGVNGFVLTVLP